MEQKDSNHILVQENLELLGDTEYKGYFSLADRKSTAWSWSGLNKRVTATMETLNEQVSQVAKQATFHAIESMNDMIQRFGKVSTLLQEESQRTFYTLPEVPLTTAQDLLAKDQILFRSLEKYRTRLQQAIQSGDFQEKTLDSLHEKFDEFYETLLQREELVCICEENWKQIDRGIESLNGYIDDRDAEGLQDTVDDLLTRSNGLTKPHAEILDILIDRQLFVFRRASRAIDRDNPALSYYDTFVGFLERTTEYLEFQQPNIRHSPHYTKLEEVPALLPKIRAKRDELYHISSPEKHDEEDSPDESVSVRRQQPRNLLITGAGVALVATLLLLLL